MARTRASAKSAGTRFESSIAACLARWFDDDRIERRARTGANDRGDIAGVQIWLPRGKLQQRRERIVIECKDVARMDLSGWVREAQAEAINDDAFVGVVVHKRLRSGDPLDQYVTCTVREFISLISGQKIIPP